MYPFRFEIILSGELGYIIRCLHTSEPKRKPHSAKTRPCCKVINLYYPRRKGVKKLYFRWLKGYLMVSDSIWQYDNHITPVTVLPFCIPQLHHYLIVAICLLSVEKHKSTELNHLNRLFHHFYVKCVSQVDYRTARLLIHLS